MAEQLNLFGEIVQELNRDKGPGYIAHTGYPDHDWIRTQFIERFGFEPAEIFIYKYLTMIGPVPERDWDLDQVD